MSLASQPLSLARQPSAQGLRNAHFPPRWLGKVWKIGAPPGFWAAFWCLQATHKPRDPSQPRPRARRLEPFRVSPAHFDACKIIYKSTVGLPGKCCRSIYTPR